MSEYAACIAAAEGAGAARYLWENRATIAAGAAAVAAGAVVVGALGPAGVPVAAGVAVAMIGAREAVRLPGPLDLP